MPNSPAIIDPDYSGDEDEVQLSLYNTSMTPFKITKGERLAQGVFLPFYRVEFTEVETLGHSRGGLGSTGV